MRNGWKWRGNSSNTTYDRHDLQDFIRIIACLSVFRQSPTWAFDHMSWFSKIETTMKRLGLRKFNRMMSALSVEDSSHETYWDSYFNPCVDMVEFAYVVSKQCVKIGFVRGHTDLVIDDDKFKMRSNKCSGSG